MFLDGTVCSPCTHRSVLLSPLEHGRTILYSPFEWSCHSIDICYHQWGAIDTSAEKLIDQYVSEIDTIEVLNVSEILNVHLISEIMTMTMTMTMKIFYLTIIYKFI